MVAAHEEVLAVVHHGACCGIDKGARPPAQIGLLLKQAHTAAAFRQCDTCREARKTTADDENVFQGFRIRDSGFSKTQFYPKSDHVE